MTLEATRPSPSAATKPTTSATSKASTPNKATVPRHQSPIPDIRPGAGDWFDFCKAFLARIFGCLRIAWWPHVRKLQLAHETLQQVCMNQRRVIAIINSKGGAGKTPLTAYTAAIIQKAIGMTVALDVNENNGNLAEQLGINRNGTPVWLRSAVEDPLQVATGGKLCTIVGRHLETNLLCLASDPSSPAGSFTLPEFLRMIRTVHENQHTLVADTGNGNENVPNRGMVQATDVLLVPILADKPSSFGSAVTTLNDYHTLGYADVVRESLLVVGATRRRDSTKQIMAALRKEVVKHVVVNKEDDQECDAAMARLGITEDRIFMIPFSAFIKRTSDRVTLNPRDIGIRSLIAMYELAIAIYRLPIATATEKETRNQRAAQIQADLTAKREQEAARRRGEFEIAPAS